MKAWKTWMVAGLVAAGTAGGGFALAEEKAGAAAAPANEGDWKPLWDGQSSKGWKRFPDKPFPAKGWTLADGMLTVQARGGGGDIVTEQSYGNFELTFEFRLTAGANSGIKYFIDPAKTGGQPIGFEYQILDDAKHPDAKLGREGNRMQGSLYDVLPAASDKPVRPIGEWNEGRIVVRGAQIEHWLNGAKVLAVDRTSDAFKAAVAASKFSKVETFGKLEAGRILLQDHGDTVSFRNLRIRELAAEKKK